MSSKKSPAAAKPNGHPVPAAAPDGVPVVADTHGVAAQAERARNRPAPLGEFRADETSVVASEALQTQRSDLRMEGDDGRVIVRPFMLGTDRVRDALHRVEQLPDDALTAILDRVLAGYTGRHHDLLKTFMGHFQLSRNLVGEDHCDRWDERRKLLAGAYLTMEYAIDSAALFNPSLVEHFDQTGVPAGGKRCIMSLRATGEGHVSSIVFRTGTARADGTFALDPLPGKFHASAIAPDRYYDKALFERKLREMRLRPSQTVDLVMGRLPDRFTLAQLHEAVDRFRGEERKTAGRVETLNQITFLAASNYHIDLPADARLDELVIFPMSDEESRGIEDLRLVRFTDDDGTQTYYGTYTAYNGVSTLPMMLSTRDFHRIEVHSLNGNSARNKGMALFPRRIGGNYCMCSRIDGQNLYVSYSSLPYFWEDSELLMQPTQPWELVQIGNCGSPIETKEGWLLLTHGVGPMRSYAIGATLLDLNDPLRVIGQLRQPLIVPKGAERNGYVPNVVYTCGYLEHAGKLFVPYAQADKSTSLLTVDMDPLINRLLESPPA